jgi:putative tricarboxylic transport membrane protein
MRYNKERAGSLLFFVSGGYGVALSIHLPMGKLDLPGPGIFPLALSILLIVVGALVLIGGKKQEEIVWNGALKSRIKTVVLIVLFTGLFIIALKTLGYLITSCLFLLGLFRLVSGLKWWWSAILTVTLTLSSWYLFGKILDVRLPSGYWTPLP